MLYEKFEYNINNLIGNFSLSKISIAVSGGSDSVALLYLANIWAEKNNIELFVISVDHNLREQSKQETHYIQNISNSLNRKHYSLSFDHQNNFSNLQERAREGRYDLMTNLCLELDILVLLTAHHEDDYVENFCLRLERNSGIFGLSSSNINWYNNIHIIRPLYNIPKSELVEYLVSHNIKWFEDESNSSDKYRRNVIRQKLAKGADYIRHFSKPVYREEFKGDTERSTAAYTSVREDASTGTASKLSLEAKCGKMSKAAIISQQLKTNKRIENEFKPELISAIAEAVKIFEYGFAFLDLVKFDKFSNEVKVQIINFLLIIISGQSRAARFYSVEPILKLITQDVNFKNTLHGCIIKRIQNELLIYREFGKKLPESKILLDKSVIWDNRFCITKNQEAPNCFVTHLSLKDYKIIKKQLDLEPLKNLSCKNHNAVLLTLPIIKILEKVIAIPHISYYDNDMWNFEVSFSPNFVSRFTHFC
ncbi:MULTISPECIES: tRNA lysidine(34) synthetase TilS [spotted fever group]|uniref:tRNA(Ile)-lysidine synthase n=3 Tax=spotted fever group TaxID=114277 RepID=TILS_RICRO|nr:MULTISPECIES: tRNA lysidine(34) synthetase TilS [spotted fever group]A8GQJ7.1 RecName: Full=tRNA(Ile)-lysidine synthase; AltName: Full=tRNA(Ile)-2-lysyl-cytidine synthase; AltName: Full=tRNA(Ile)-lysidine synthetase [Rickettsia rickettsii str. 'Sheila Smith']B0BVY4.1 RecName: Full=tRNA(Ile)-lysidine synthase; AltName: Full=tRNA(Ile)-2-lysyl-cytidine synthase; AltName: Full=tRNA(Ile)-lysidine synthetase [Rickettsia rickettsii str. Iowa]ABV75672.1 cell cycle protein MesJ [Rickettsia rickettsii 